MGQLDVTPVAAKVNPDGSVTLIDKGGVGRGVIRGSKKATSAMVNGDLVIIMLEDNRTAAYDFHFRLKWIK